MLSLCDTFSVQIQLCFVSDTFKPLPASVAVLIIFANSLDHDIVRQNVGPNLDLRLKLLVTLTVFLK